MSFFLWLLFLKSGFNHIAPVGLEFTSQTRLSLNSETSVPLHPSVKNRLLPWPAAPMLHVLRGVVDLIYLFISLLFIYFTRSLLIDCQVVLLEVFFVCLLALYTRPC